MNETCCTCHPRAVDEPALAFELRVVEQALAEGDLKHARHHVAGALGLAPTDARSLAAFEALAARTDLNGSAPSDYFGDHAITAHARFRAGDRDGAIDLLAQVCEAMPHLGFEHALTAWIAAGDAPLGETVANRLARLLSVVGKSTIGLHRLLPGERALLESYGTLAATFAETRPGALAMGAVSGMLRRVGRLDEALAAARSVEGAPGRIQEGLALRAAGDGAGALRAFEEAARLDRDDAYAVERARCRYVAGDAAGAVLLLADVRSDDIEIVGLRSLCERPLPGDRVDHLDALRRATRPVGLNAPSDATANAFDDPQLAELTDLRMTVTGWESPTNRLLLAVREGHTDVRRVSYTITFSDLPRPVLRPSRAGAPLWVASDGVVVQAVPAPSMALRRALVAAAEATDLDAMFERARASVEEASTGDLLAAMVHPPPEAAGTHLPTGVYRYQVACACALTACPGGLAALESVVLGPVDWTGAAVILALGEWVRRDAGTAIPGRALLLGAVNDLLPVSTEPRYFPLLYALHGLPAVPESTFDRLRAWHRKYVDDPPTPPPEPPQAPPTPKPAGMDSQTRLILIWAIVGVLGAMLYELLH